MGGSIGLNESDTWKPYLSTEREMHLSMVNNYIASLSNDLSPSTIHTKKLAFMADNGIRQVGKPRIGIYADRMRPDPLHCEINAWQHMLDVIYRESVQRGVFDSFLKTLSSPVSSNCPGTDVRDTTSNADVDAGEVAKHSETNVELSPDTIKSTLVCSSEKKLKILWVQC